jgi:diphthine-ammonia ligase
VAATALVSGGKDSIFSASLADQQGLEVGELLTIRPSDPESMMFHTPNLGLVALQAEAWGKDHRTVVPEGSGEEAETAALRGALASGSGWVVAGAIASSYQWARLHRVCFELGRPLFTPLWGKSARTVVEAEILAGLDIRLVHLAAEPLGPELLGDRLDAALLDRLELLGRTVRPVHVAGEGGEYESLVVDAPFFERPIVLDELETHSHAGAHGLVVRRAHLGEPRRPRPG